MTDKKILSQEDVKKVAQLARVEISEQEQEKFANEISSILDYVKDLGEADTSEAIKFDHYDLEGNHFRNDEVFQMDEKDKEGIRELFPQREGNCLKVKTVLNGK